MTKERGNMEETFPNVSVPLLLGTDAFVLLFFSAPPCPWSKYIYFVAGNPALIKKASQPGR